LNYSVSFRSIGGGNSNSCRQVKPSDGCFRGSLSFASSATSGSLLVTDTSVFAYKPHDYSDFRLFSSSLVSSSDSHSSSVDEEKDEEANEEESKVSDLTYTGLEVEDKYDKLIRKWQLTTQVRDEMTRVRRRMPFIDYRLVQKVLKMKESGKNEVIKTWARSCTIIPLFVGLTIGVHNGRKHIPVFIKEEMIGYKLGEFSPTRTFYKHTSKTKAEVAGKGKAGGPAQPASPGAGPAKGGGSSGPSKGGGSAAAGASAKGGKTIKKQ
jgi:small subunit ribosomal protein S19